MGVDGAGLVPWVGGPPDASFGFYLAFQSQTNTQDMLWELKNSNCTRYHIELINMSCGGWLDSTLL